MRYGFCARSFPACPAITAAAVCRAAERPIRTSQGALYWHYHPRFQPARRVRQPRIPRHRVFAKVAARGKSSTGWFYGLKLHIAINHRGELLSIKVTPGNVDDRKPVAFLCRRLFGRVYADKG